MDRNALFDEHLRWADETARAVHRRLPPSFDLEDLEQAARVELWKRVRLYDPAVNDSFRGYAYRAIKGACLMICRRRHWRDHTGEALDGAGVAVAIREQSEGEMADAVERRRREWREARRRRIIRSKLQHLEPEEAGLVRAILVDGVRIEEYAAGGDVAEVRRALRAAVRKLGTRSRGISRGARDLYVYLISHGGANLKQADLATDMNCTTRTLRNRIRELKARGLLRMRRKQRGNEMFVVDQKLSYQTRA